jgi:hypothetical protein
LDAKRDPIKFRSSTTKSMVCEKAWVGSPLRAILQQSPA